MMLLKNVNYNEYKYGFSIIFFRFLSTEQSSFGEKETSHDLSLTDVHCDVVTSWGAGIASLLFTAWENIWASWAQFEIDVLEHFMGLKFHFEV